MKPQRIQRKRTKGWRMPDNTVYVGRGSRWGNPFPTHEPERDGHGDVISGRMVEVRSQEEAVKLYRTHTIPYQRQGINSTLAKFLISEANIRAAQELRGKNLACWCPIDQPCHADVLLEIANEESK